MRRIKHFGKCRYGKLHCCPLLLTSWIFWFEMLFYAAHYAVFSLYVGEISDARCIPNTPLSDNRLLLLLPNRKPLNIWSHFCKGYNTKTRTECIFRSRRCSPGVCEYYQGFVSHDHPRQTHPTPTHMISHTVKEVTHH